MTRAVLAAVLAGLLPPAGAADPARRVAGELVAADFVHRTGQFRTAAGDVRDFALPPDGVVSYVGADADLRDVPLGTFCQFILLPDAAGEFTRLVQMRDQFSADAADGVSYRPGGPGPGGGKLVVTAATRVWKGDKPATAADLTADDNLLVNLAGVTGRCADVWAGAAAQKQATDRQRRAHAAFVKARGLAGNVDRTDGRTLTVTLFGGDRAAFERTWLAEFSPGRDVKVVVANSELRTWNPPVDQEYGKVVGVEKGVAGGSGVRLVLSVRHMLEGFRRGRVVRVFGGPWPSPDQPFGEQLFHYGSRALPPDLMELPPREYPEQFPFRTDHGNAHLPWYRLRPGVVPPQYSDHLVFGELVAADPAGRAGRFRADRTGAEVNFSLLPDGSVRFLGAPATLPDIPPGTRCRFHLYQDDRGAFTRASLVLDEFSELAADGVVWRVTGLALGEGKLFAARQPPGVKNDQGDPEQPPDTGRAEFRVGPDTRVWKLYQRLAPADLKVGDLLRLNVGGERPGHPSACADIWVGVDTHKLITDRQAHKAPAAKR